MAMTHHRPDQEVKLPADLAEDPSLTYRAAAEAATEQRSLETDTAFASIWQIGMAETRAPESQKRSASPIFRLKRLLGEGGMGEVWEALQVSLERLVAVKRIRRDFLTEQADSLRLYLKKRLFRDEALIAARLEHPNIVPVHDFGVDETGNLMLAMKRVEGKSWDQILSKDFPSLSPAEFLDKHLPILISVAQAVAFAHSRKIIHRDLKPAQVMVGDFGEVLLMDWGLSLFFGEPEEMLAAPDTTPLPTRESAHSPSGTPAMMAPEQTRPDARGLGPWTDIYLLGGILYYLLTGTYPHQAGNSREAMRLAANGIVDPPNQRAPDRDIPAELAQLAIHCMKKEPGDRLASAEGFLQGLNDYFTGRGRRIESVQATDEVRAELLKPNLEYREYSEFLTRLNRALLLWPRNPAVARLRDECHARYAAEALRHGDLRLARMQAENVAESAARIPILERITGAEREVHRREQQRRIAAAAAALFLLVIAAGGLFFTQRLRAERDFAKAQQLRAESARDRALSLVQFLHEDQRDSLEAHGHLGLIQQSGERIAQFFSELPDSEFTPRVRAAHATALLNLAMIKAREGKFEESTEHIREVRSRFAALRDSREIADEAIHGTINAGLWEAQGLRFAGKLIEAKELLDQIENDPQHRDYLAGTGPNNLKSRLGIASERYFLLVAQGQLEEGAALLDAAIERNRPEVESRIEDTELLRDFVYRMEQRTHVDLALGESERAARRLEKAAEYWRHLYSVHPDDARIISGLSSNYRHHANVLVEQNQPAAAIELYGRSLDLLNQLVSKDPFNTDHQAPLAMTHQRAVMAHRAVGDLDKALEHAAKSTRQLEKLLAIDPENADLKSDLAYALQVLARVYIDLAEYDLARETLHHATVLIKPVAEQQPPHSNLNFLIVVLQNDLGDAEAADRQPEHAAAHYAAALKNLEAMGEIAGRSPRLMETHLGILLALARQQLLLNLRPEAATSIDTATGLFNRLAETSRVDQFADDLEELRRLSSGDDSAE